MIKSRRVMAYILALSLAIGCIACGKNTAETDADSHEVEVVEDNENITIDNMINNGDFSDGVSGWNLVTNNEGKAVFEEKDGNALVSIDNVGNAEEDIQIYYDGFELERNGVYEISFDMQSSENRKIGIRIQQNGGNNKRYYDKHIDSVDKLKHYSFEFSMKSKSDPTPRLYINLGANEKDAALSAHSVSFDNISIIFKESRDIINEKVNETSSDKNSGDIVSSNNASINLNQVGYMPKARKTFVVRAEGVDKAFSILDESGTEVYSGTLSGPIEAAKAKENVMQGDFSDFNTPGKYTIKISNGEVSYPFEIGDGVYTNVLKDSLLMLTKQRCGVELSSDIAGSAAHPVCHNTEAVIYGTDKKKEVDGGWHDAGDYGRYVVAGATTIDDLFLAYEDYPEIWSADDLGIPESGNGIPDILDEAKYELDWMLKMQDEKTGGVYHKVTCYSFPGFVMPQLETDELVLSPISNTATGDFAAIMAKASMLYKEYDPEFSSLALEKAKYAYEYLEGHMNEPGFKNPSDISTGEYGDGSFSDEMYWASIELYKNTGDQKYKDYFESSINKGVMHGFGWDSMGSYGNIAYMTLDENEQNPELLKKITDGIYAVASGYLANSKNDGYMMAVGDYWWGSNLAVCSYARQMLMAANISGDVELENAAYDQLSYILGQNATGYCFVTGYGTVSPVNPHHRVSFATKAVVPGMVVGGPNGNFEDDYVKGKLKGFPPAKVYADNTDSYSTNEVAIYWNSPFTYLLTAEIAKNQ